MKRTLLLILCISFALFSQAQKLTKTISNEKTEQHVNIPGTQVFLVIPDGYKLDEIGTSVRKGMIGSLQVESEPGVDYTLRSVLFTEKHLAQNGLKKINVKKINVGNYPAKYAVYENASGLSKCMDIIFGDHSFTTKITTSYSAGNKSEEQTLISMLESIYFDPDHTIDPLSNAPFTIDTSRSVYKEISLVGMSIKCDNPGNDYASLYLSLATRAAWDQKSSFLDIYPNTYIRDGGSFIVSKEKEDKIGGYDFFLKEYITTTEAGEEALIYCGIITNGKRHLIFTSFIEENREENIEEIDKLLGGVAFR
ncbi:hypothetical protein LJC68_10400 [Bacteroidales bacterium OttesenSCG-928-B11]|nr:hypothetical protein [Bacteroidales bacterium OttesenSCG-928-C03]MDL2313272.1 hypothetical protein [Bacteroidales bacterium OttesenSCG-928-B11]MDL2326772.1 hypothetical protein [Bacteroidales bacterium OttesenSCG-928-A14]